MVIKGCPLPMKVSTTGGGRKSSLGKIQGLCAIFHKRTGTFARGHS